MCACQDFEAALAAQLWYLESDLIVLRDPNKAVFYRPYVATFRVKTKLIYYLCLVGTLVLVPRQQGLNSCTERAFQHSSSLHRQNLAVLSPSVDHSCKLESHFPFRRQNNLKIIKMSLPCHHMHTLHSNSSICGELTQSKLQTDVTHDCQHTLVLIEASIQKAIAMWIWNTQIHFQST